MRFHSLSFKKEFLQDVLFGAAKIPVGQPPKMSGLIIIIIIIIIKTLFYEGNIK